MLNKYNTTHPISLAGEGNVVLLSDRHLQEEHTITLRTINLRRTDVFTIPCTVSMCLKFQGSVFGRC